MGLRRSFSVPGASWGILGLEKGPEQRECGFEDVGAAPACPAETLDQLPPSLSQVSYL